MPRYDTPFDDDDEDDLDDDDEDDLDDEDEDEDEDERADERDGDEHDGDEDAPPASAPPREVPPGDGAGDGGAAVATVDDDGRFKDPRFAAARGFVADHDVPVVDAVASVDSAVAAGCAVVSSGLAAALAVDGRGTAWVDERLEAQNLLLSPEEKLLRAIFGELSATAEVVAAGPLRAPARLIKTPADGEAWFKDAPAAVVTRVRALPRSTGVVRHAVDLTFTNPVELGDVVVDARGVCAVISGFVRSDGRVHTSPWPAPPSPGPPAPTKTALFSRSVDELEMSVRSANALQNAGITTVGQLASRTESELLKLEGIGRQSLRELTELLGTLGLSFGMHISEAGNDDAAAVDAAAVDAGPGRDVEAGGERFVRSSLPLVGPFTVERPTARERLVARSIGPCSPLNGRPTGDAVVVTAAQRRALAVRAPAAAREIAWRSDDDRGRARLYEAIVRGDDPAAAVAAGSTPVATRSLSQLDALLAVLGFGIDVVEGGLRLVFTGLGRAAPPSPTSTAPPASSSSSPSSSGLRDIFSFFEAPKPDAPPRARRHDEPWSHGVVLKPETLNYRTLSPEPGGLFCERVFGPVVDYECHCKKYKRMKHRGVVCERCGVEVLASRVRGERFAHIPLAFPVVPKHLQPLLARRLGVDVKPLLEAATEDGGKDLVARVAAATRHGDDDIPTGALLWTVVPVLPPDLRPIVSLPGGRFMTSDLNDLYRRVINRNNRLRRLVELDAPAIIVQSERRELQAAVDGLVVNTLLQRPVRGPDRRPLHDAAAVVADNLVDWRRVDHAGASVVVVDGALDGDAVALPRALACALWRPFLYRLLEERGYVTTIKSARNMVDDDRAEARAALADATADAAVWLAAGDAVAGGRVVAVDDGPALRLSRSLAQGLGVTSGDTVAVHLPLSTAAAAEVRGLPPTRPPPPQTGWLGLLQQALQQRGDVGAVLTGNVGRVDGASDVARALLVRGA